jgi:hypothetical protein
MKKTIGRLDKADFPDLDLEKISVKIDTGAYTSSIHCDSISIENELLKCRFLDEEHSKYNHRAFQFDCFNIIKVKSSNGIQEERYAVKSRIEVFGKNYPITLSLSDRKDMRHPVLLGRKFLNKKFVVDPQLKNISFDLNNPSS